MFKLSQKNCYYLKTFRFGRKFFDTFLDFNFDFHWHIDYDSEVIHFSVVSKNGTFADNRWLLIGFSNNGNILNSDYCVFKNKNVTV